MNLFPVFFWPLLCPGIKRDHHPDVKIGAMLKQASKPNNVMVLSIVPGKEGA